jgi:hypothetical protein
MTERYRLHVPDSVLDDLRDRLARTRWPDEIPDSGWRFGSHLAFMRRLTDYWRDEFDWRAQEAKLNAFDHYRVEIDDIDLHYIHQPGVGPDPIPLLLVHGWPGSVWEFHQLIPRLTDPARFGGDPADAFTVIAPSLPGFTLSFTPHQRRLGIVEMADLCAAHDRRAGLLAVRGTGRRLGRLRRRPARPRPRRPAPRRAPELPPAAARDAKEIVCRPFVGAYGALVQDRAKFGGCERATSGPSGVRFRTSVDVARPGIGLGSPSNNL